MGLPLGPEGYNGQTMLTDESGRMDDDVEMEMEAQIAVPSLMRDGIYARR